MYAIIRAGGKQHKVAKGDVIQVELAKGQDKVEYTPLLIVDDKGKARTTPKELSAARVMGTVVGQTAGPKVKVFKYRNKSGYRRTTGHRQKYASIEISDIKLTGGRAKKSDDEEAEG